MSKSVGYRHFVAALISMSLVTLLLLSPTARAQQPTASEPSEGESAAEAPEPAMEPVEEQSSFRANSGLRSDEEYITALASDAERRAPDDVGTWGIPLTRDELAELNRRVAIGVAAPLIKEYATAEMPSDLFAGLWQEQRNNGRIVVALTRPAPDHEQAIRELFPFPSDIEFVVREVRLDQLSAVYDRAVALMGPAVGDALINNVSVDEIGGTVTLLVPPLTSFAEVQLAFPEPFVEIVTGEKTMGIREAQN